MRAKVLVGFVAGTDERCNNRLSPYIAMLSDEPPDVLTRYHTAPAPKNTAPAPENIKPIP